MKHILLLSLLLILTGAGCATAPQDSMPASSAIESNAAETVPSSSMSASDAETALGISLPENSVVTALVDNSRAVAVSANTNDSLAATQQFFDEELQQKGYQIIRSWGVSPMDNPTLQSAAFRGNGESWSVNIRVNGNTTSYDIQRQK